MRELAVKLGYFENCSFFGLLKVCTFSNEAFGGPDPDRTGDLLHAMHVNFILNFEFENRYLFGITKNSYWRSIDLPADFYAHICSKMKTKAGVVGGKIGVRRQNKFGHSFDSNFPEISSLTFTLSKFQFQKSPAWGLV